MRSWRELGGVAKLVEGLFERDRQIYFFMVKGNVPLGFFCQIGVIIKGEVLHWESSKGFRNTSLLQALARGVATCFEFLDRCKGGRLGVAACDTQNG